MPDARSTRIRRPEGDLPRPFRSAEERAHAPDPVAVAFEHGREQGRIEGRDEATAEYVKQAEALRVEVTRSLKHLSELEDEIVRRNRQAMIDLALEIASRLLRERVEAGDPVAARVLTEALDLLPSGHTLRAHVHPDDVDAVRRDLADLLERRGVELAADDDVGRGGCIVESPGGTIDASVGTALSELREAAEGAR
jgi:flagellar assembly protein FliH